MAVDPVAGEAAVTRWALARRDEAATAVQVPTQLRPDLTSATRRQGFEGKVRDLHRWVVAATG
jgi:hypothetical protein